MSYRKIEVNDKIYEYVVGKVNTKIKGVGVFDNEEIAGRVNPEPGFEYDYDAIGTEVTPSIIRGLILNNKAG